LLYCSLEWDYWQGGTLNHSSIKVSSSVVHWTCSFLLFTL
jgi:hypothetical protein